MEKSQFVFTGKDIDFILNKLSLVQGMILDLDNCTDTSDEKEFLKSLHKMSKAVYDCETRIKTLTTDKSFIEKDGYFVDDNGNVFFPRDLQRTLIKFKNTGTSKNFADFCELLCSVYDLMRKSSPEKFTEEDFANEKKEMYLSSSSLFALDRTEAYWKLSKRLSNKMKELNIKFMK